MGLVGMEIPESARIISVADVFDCLTSTRSYRKAWSVEEAIVELRACAGTQFDPRMVEALVRAVEREGWETPDITEPPGGCYGSEAAEEAAAKEAAEDSGEASAAPEGASSDKSDSTESTASAEAVTGGRDR